MFDTCFGELLFYENFWSFQTGEGFQVLCVCLHVCVCAYTLFYSVSSDVVFLMGISNARAILNRSLFLKLPFCPAALLLPVLFLTS